MTKSEIVRTNRSGAIDRINSCCDLLERLTRALECVPCDSTEDAAQYETTLTPTLDRLTTILGRLRGTTTAQHAAQQPRPDQRLAELGENPPAGCENRMLEGTTENLPLVTVLDLLHNNRRTGVLRVASAVEVFCVEIEEGSVRHAWSDQTPASDRLGAIAVESGDITRDGLARALDRVSTSDLRTGEALAAEQVCPDRILHALEEQTHRLFHRLLETDSAVFEFYERGPISGPDTFFQPRLRIAQDVRELMLEHARRSDEVAREVSAGPQLPTEACSAPTA